jgi:hypothetical protein
LKYYLKIFFSELVANSELKNNSANMTRCTRLLFDKKIDFSKIALPI